MKKTISFDVPEGAKNVSISFEVEGQPATQPAKPGFRPLPSCDRIKPLKPFKVHRDPILTRNSEVGYTDEEWKEVVKVRREKMTANIKRVFTPLCERVVTEGVRKVLFDLDTEYMPVFWKPGGADAEKDFISLEQEEFKRACSTPHDPEAVLERNAREVWNIIRGEKTGEELNHLTALMTAKRYQQFLACVWEDDLKMRNKQQAECRSIRPKEKESKAMINKIRDEQALSTSIWEIVGVKAAPSIYGPSEA